MTDETIPTLQTLRQRAKAGDGQALQALRDGGFFRARQGWPVSRAQHRLWIAQQMDPSGGAYNIPLALQLLGELDAVALRADLQALMGRHESLRTRFGMVEGELRQFVDEDLELPWTELDLSEEPDPERQALELATREANAPFDLAAGPLLRSLLLRLGPGRHVWVVTIHHIVSDLASQDLLICELSGAYGTKGGVDALEPLPIQYKDFALWQNRKLSEAQVTAHRDYWHRQLAGPLSPLDFPADFPRPPVRSHRGGIRHVRLDTSLSRRLQALGADRGMSLFMVLVALVKVLLYRHARQEEILLGFPSSGRDRPELAGMVGCFVNMVVLRDRLQGEDTLAQVFQRVRKTMLEAYQHQAYPFDRLADELGWPRDASRNPALDAVVSLAHGGVSGAGFGEVKVLPLADVYSAAKFDLSFDFTETPDGLDLAITYSLDLFLGERMSRLAGHFRRLAALAVEDLERPIGRLPLLPDEEREQVLAAFNRTSRDLPDDRTFADLFEEQAALHPHLPAARFQGQTLDYGELNRRANRLAHWLVQQGAGPETRVGLFLEPCLELPVAVMGIFKSGAVYVPLDPANPEQRLAALLQESQLALLLTDSQLAARLPAADAAIICLDQVAGELASQPEHNPARPSRPDAVAYLIHTSGTTGRPKGAVLLQRGLSNNIHEQRRLFGLGPGDALPQLSSPGFDASLLEFTLAYASGAVLVLAPRERRLPGPGLVELLEEEKITAGFFPPSTLAVLPDAPLPSLRQIIVGGEPCTAQVVDRWAPGRRFTNLYGPTETTIFVCHAECQAHEPPTIGRPIANLRVYLLDEYLQPVPWGSAGELCVAGPGVGRHYLNQPQISAERFVEDPFSGEPGARLYRTGDLARHLPDGSLQFMGRMDHQVKLRGYRIEPGEIETALARHPDIALAAVLAREDEPGRQYLAAYFTVKEPSHIPAAAELREHLQACLPVYMVPSRFVFMQEMPATASGKLDRKALPAPAAAAEEARAAFVPPAGPLEQVLADVFAEVLQVPRPVGGSDNFFELGGDSLMAAQMISRLRETLRVSVSLPQLFLARDLADLARGVRRCAPEGEADKVAEIVLRLKGMSDEEKQALLKKRQS